MPESLWIVHGSKPCPWSVPFRVNWKDSAHGVAWYAVPLLNRQLDAVIAVMDTIGSRVEGVWHVTRPNLERVAQQVDNTLDPQLCLAWRQSLRLPTGVKIPPGKAERDEFLDSLFSSGMFGSREQLDILWNQICSHALDWLVNREKPLDLYFVRLHNCPYRANWKNVLLSRFPRLGRIFCHTGPVKREIVSNESGFDDELRCMDLLAMGHTEQESACIPTIYRTIEVEMRPHWHKTVARVEHQRLKILNPIGYAKYVIGSVERFADTAQKVYVQWCNLLARKSAADVECGDNGEFRLVPNRPPRDLAYLGRKGFPVPVVVPNHLPKVKSASPAGDLFPKDGILPDEMSPVRPSSPDLRDRRPDLHLRERRPGDSARMLVLSASKDTTPL